MLRTRIGAPRRGSWSHWLFPADRGIGLVLLALFLALSWADPYPIEFVRSHCFDMYQKFRPRVVTERPVTIIDIDESSLAEFGQWPWPRTTLAALVTNLGEAGASVIAFDVVFAEPDRTNPDLLAASLHGLDEEARSRLRALPSNDSLLADAFAKTRVRFDAGNWVEEAGRVVIGEVALFADGAATALNAETDPPPARSVAWLGSVEGVPAPAAFLPRFEGMVRNIPVLEAAAAGHGILSLLPEPGGWVRRLPTFLVGGERLHPSLPIEMLRVAMRQDTSQVATGFDGVEDVRIGNPQGGLLSIPTDGQGRVWPYFAHHDPEKFISARDVLTGTADPSRIAGHMVLIGTSAAGLLDLHWTPVGATMSGAEIHAQLVEAVVTGQLLSRPAVARYWELGMLALTGALVIVLVPWVEAVWALGLFLAMVGGMAAASWYQFTQSLRLLDVSFSLFSMVIIFTAMTYMRFSREVAHKREIRAAFADQLRSSEDKFRRLFLSSPVAMSITRLSDRRLADVNDAWLAMMGYAREDVVGRTPDELGIWADASSREPLFEAIARSGGYSGVEHLDRRKDGSELSILAWGRMIPIDGEPHVVATAIDITQRRAWERRIEQMNRRLAAAKTAADSANRAKSAFLAQMSHEIRTPLNGVIGMIDLALMYMDDPEKAKSYLALSKGAAWQLTDLLGDILDLAKVEAGQLLVENTPFAFRAEIETTLAALRISAERQGLAFSCDIAADVPDEMVADVGRLRQVLTNLVENAIKFTPAGSVRLAVRLEDGVVFEVSDTGIGIPEDQRERIFESFVQGDPPARARFGGAGLGLAISRHLVELMGGRIWVESTVGQGSRFSFVLPLSQTGKAAGRPSVDSPAPPGPR